MNKTSHISAERTVVKSLPVRSSPSQYVGRIMSRLLIQWCWLLLIPLIIFGFLALDKWQWLVVGLAILFLIYPFVLAMVYFNYALSPESRRFIRPMIIKLKPEGLEIVYLEEQPTDKNESAAKQPKFKIVSSEVFPFDRIESYSTAGNTLIIRFKEPKYATVAIRVDQWDGENKTDVMNNAVSFLTENGIKIA